MSDKRLITIEVSGFVQVLIDPSGWDEESRQELIDRKNKLHDLTIQSLAEDVIVIRRDMPPGATLMSVNIDIESIDMAEPIEKPPQEPSDESGR